MMRNLMSLVSPLLLLACSLLLPSTTCAEEIVITHGFKTHGLLERADSFSFKGQNFAAYGGTSSPVFGPRLGGGSCYFIEACRPGVVYDISTRYESRLQFGRLLANGPAIYHGTSYESLFFLGFLEFTGSIVIPEVPQTTYAIPFTFSGRMTGHKRIFPEGVPSETLFDVTLSGQGVALTGGQYYGRIVYTFQHATAVVEPVTTVPEPATMLLLGTGLAGVVAAMRKRCKAKKGEETLFSGAVEMINDSQAYHS